MRTSGTTQTLAMTAAAVLLLARTSAAAERERAVDTSATRRIVVSIPDRKLALVENDQVVAVYPVAVGGPISPSPVGTVSIVNRASIATCDQPGKGVGDGAVH